MPSWSTLCSLLSPWLLTSCCVVRDLGGGMARMTESARQSKTTMPFHTVVTTGPTPSTVPKERAGAAAHPLTPTMASRGARVKMPCGQVDDPKSLPGIWAKDSTNLAISLFV